MSRWTARWRALPAGAKFRLYTGITYQSAIAAVVVAMTVTARSPWAAAGIVLAGIAAVVAVEARADFAVSSELATHRWVLPVAIATLMGVWLACAVVAGQADDESVLVRARMAGVYVAVLGVFSVVSLIRYKWWILLALSVVTGLVFASSPSTAVAGTVVTFLCGAFVIATTWLTVWGLRVVDEVEHAKEIEAELQVAQERLRFARDLHDVVGRGFSAIAVKSELAVALSRAGNIDRATAEMDEVKALAVESMGQMRELVRGYRGIDLLGEVAGARSLLAAVGCALGVEGDPAAVPPRFHEVAAWVVREGTTNIVEHSAATTATLAFGGSGMSLRNDGPRGIPGQHSGLRGLAERLAAVGASLAVTASSDEFVLEILWEKQ
ncbi:sensor histidine kinase [Nocardia jinanensis]|uniref:Sensor histidine kinase n=1 Tax=Nocardia jinanensis TaxID=382504 RepID=A0A917W0I6_9NOCA|nr:histidine kinase [Nocardia jinanensis]GGL46574.1 sensor histidine kinase [Nocardia jinanensis]